ncbi:uvrabc system protein b [Plakobranchus ocellatus]|uniref:UvrABC system protein B n=1 Tax=Plakobranchus ocellatus TaxID=259542 RepID=A0AAV4D7N5_9GAST|nr:uvrabc system protein b [Plakobranchus ocellatus]
MFNGDRARKQSLVDYGFRLPSALENRPLVYDEFLKISSQYVFVSATPNEYEIALSQNQQELINRPTGLLDPTIAVKSSAGQIDDLIFEIRKEVKKDNCVLVTTLTKKMAEDLADFLKDNQIRVTYLHSDIETIERVEIITSLRQKKINVIIGINLLREGLDIPEVSLVAILDADKIGFLRSKTSLIQTVGRAARNQRGRVIMYADKISEAMAECIKETNERRKIQIAYNQKNNITPKSIKKPVSDILEREEKINPEDELASNYAELLQENPRCFKKNKVKKIIAELDLEMKLAADQMDFEKAIFLRDKINALKLQHKLDKV